MVGLTFAVAVDWDHGRVGVVFCAQLCRESLGIKLRLQACSCLCLQHAAWDKGGVGRDPNCFSWLWVMESTDVTG